MVRVLVTVPGVEDLHGIIVLLRAAGAQITTGYREFEICGPLNGEQAAAVWALARHEDGNSEGNQLGVQVEPAGDLRDALDAMCPDGWSPSQFDWRREDVGNPHRWWAEQQARQKELKKSGWKAPAAAPPVAPVVTSPPPSPAVPADGCCGEGGVWAPKAGEDLVNGCQLCPQSATYWRRGPVAAQAS